MAGASVLRLPRPLLELSPRAVCLTCGSVIRGGSRPALTRNYTTAREREWAKTVDRYYSDILHDPRKPGPVPNVPEPEYKNAAFPMTERDKTIERARVVFGSRLAGPKERQRELDAHSTLIAGVLVPPRPDEPDNCCMSGCVNCVWDRYGEELQEWAAKSAQAREAQRRQTDDQGGEKKKIRKNQPQGEEPANVLSMDDDGGGSEALWTGSDADNLPGIGGKNKDDDLFAGIPVGIREFMRTEKRLREEKLKGSKQKQRNQAS